MRTSHYRIQSVGPVLFQLLSLRSSSFSTRFSIGLLFYYVILSCLAITIRPPGMYRHTETTLLHHIQ
jgi:hypothetical protein